MNDELNQKGSLLKSFDKALTTGAKYLSARGYLLWLVILPTVAVTTANPSILGIGASFVEFATENFADNFIDGWSIIGSAAFDDAINVGEHVMDAAL